MDWITLHWQKKQYNFSWCQFDSLLLNDPRLTHKYKIEFETIEDVQGIYIIFEGLTNDKTLDVGSGYIKQRFSEHLGKPEFQTYKYRSLYATWATLPLSIQLNLSTDEMTDKLRGIEKYLSSVLAPVELGKRFPQDVETVIVNDPWYQPLQRFLNSAGKYKPLQSNPYRTPLEQALACLKGYNKSNPYQ